MSPRLAGLSRCRRLGHVTKQRDGKERPPDRHADKSDPRGHLGISHAKGAGEQDPRQVDGEQQPPTDIAPGIARRGDLVDLVRFGHMRQERIVEYVGAREPDASEHIEHRGQQPVPGAHQIEQRRRQHAHRGERAQHPLFAAGVVSDRPQDRRGKGHQRHGDAVGIAPIAGGSRRRQPRPRHAAVERGEHHRHDGGGKGRVGPIIEAPRPHDPPVSSLHHVTHGLTPRTCAVTPPTSPVR